MYKATCEFCGYKINGLNLAKLRKQVQVGDKKGSYICGGSCWGNYMSTYDWERCPCAICIQWHLYIEALKGHAEASPFEGKAAESSDTGGPMYLESDITGKPFLQEIKEQNRQLLAAVASQGTIIESMAAMLSQQQEALQGQCNIITKLFSQIEKMPTKEDIKDLVTKEDVLENIHDLNEKTDLLSGYCKKMDSKLTSIGAKSPPASVDMDDLPPDWTATSPSMAH